MTNPWGGIVRCAQPSEEAEIMQMCRKLHEENGLYTIDDDLVRDMMRRAFERRGGILGVIGKPGSIEAMIYLLLSTYWASRDSHLEELFAYVRPEHRKSNHSATLVKFARDCSEYLKIPLVIGIVSNRRTAAKVRLYQRILGPLSGGFFVVNAKWHNGVEPDKEAYFNLVEVRGHSHKKIAAALQDAVQIARG